MSLRRFPIDVQTCSLMLSSCSSSFDFRSTCFSFFLFSDAYGTRDVIYDWKLDEHNGVEFERLKLSQFHLFHYKISQYEIRMNDRKKEFFISFHVVIRLHLQEIILFSNWIYESVEVSAIIFYKVIFRPVYSLFSLGFHFGSIVKQQPIVFISVRTYQLKIFDQYD